MPNLRERTYTGIRRNSKFFLACLGHESLQNYYRMNFSLMQYHKYSLEELEEMLPFEREIYIHMLVQYLEEEKQRIESQKRM